MKTRYFIEVFCFVLSVFVCTSAMAASSCVGQGLAIGNLQAIAGGKSNPVLSQLLNDDQRDRKEMSKSFAAGLDAVRAASARSGVPSGSSLPLSSVGRVAKGKPSLWTGADDSMSGGSISEGNARDAVRAREVVHELRDHSIISAHDFFAAAMIFQHGDCSSDYRVANQFASISMQAGFRPARTLYADTLDRYLESIGEKQKFGTQYSIQNGEVVLNPVDPKTTDAERAKYDVKPLKQAKAMAAEMLVN